MNCDPPDTYDDYLCLMRLETEIIVWFREIMHMSRFIREQQWPEGTELHKRLSAVSKECRNVGLMTVTKDKNGEALLVTKPLMIGRWRRTK